MVRRRHSQPVGEDSKPVAVRYPPAPKQFFETAWDTPGEPDAYPATLNLSTNLIERVAGFLLHVANTPGADWSGINTELQQAAQNVAYELIRAKELQIIGADDADPDPLLAKSKIVVYSPGDSGAPAGLPGSDYIVQYHPKLTLPSGPHLSGSFTRMAGTEFVNLTTEGATDWGHYGSPNALDHKSGGPNSFSGVAGAAGNFGGAHQDGQPTFTWSDGTPAASGSDFGGYYSFDTLQISVPASTTSQHLRLYIGVYFCRGRLTAHLGDSSAPDYTNASLENDSSDGIAGNTTGYYDILFASGAATTLTLTYVRELGHGNVHIHAATLNPDTYTPPAPDGGGITLNGLDDVVVASENGGFHADPIAGGYNLKRVAPTPAVHVALNGTEGTITDSTEGNHRRRNIALSYTPPVAPKTPPQPCNCDTGGSKKPPPTPPTPPPDIPTPTPPSKQSWSCVALIDDSGIGFSGSIAGGVAVGVKYYEQNNTPLASAITTTLTAELSPALQGGDTIISFDMRFTGIMQISPFTVLGLSDPILTRPEIVKIDGSDATDYYYFQRLKTETILPGPLVHDVYDGHAETITVGNAGYADWAFNVAYLECEIGRAFTNALLQFCGATIKYWEPLFDYPFDGTEQVLGDGMHDVYNNYVTPFDTSAFLGPDGYSIATDQLHGFRVQFAPIGDTSLRSAKTTAVIAGHIKSIPGGENNDTNMYLSIQGGGVTVASGPLSILHDDDKDFSFTVAGTFNVGTEYIFILTSDISPNVQYYLTDVRGALT